MVEKQSKKLMFDDSLLLENKTVLPDDVTVEIIDSNEFTQIVKQQGQRKRMKSNLPKFPLAISSYSKPMAHVDKRRKSEGQSPISTDGSLSALNISKPTKIPSSCPFSGGDSSASANVPSQNKVLVSPFCHDVSVGSVNTKSVIDTPSSTRQRSGRRKRPPSRYIDIPYADSPSGKIDNNFINLDSSDCDMLNTTDESSRMTAQSFPVKRQRTRRSLIEYTNVKANKRNKLQTDKVKAVVDHQESISDVLPVQERISSIASSIDSSQEAAPQSHLGRPQARRKSRGRPRKIVTNSRTSNASTTSCQQAVEDQRTVVMNNRVSPVCDVEASSDACSTSRGRGRPRKRGRGRISLPKKSLDVVINEVMKCGVCLREFQTNHQFKRHTFVEHNGLARPYGQNEPFTEKEERDLQQQCIKVVGRLQCLVPTCSRTFTTFGGYVYHANICGKEEREMITCELCGRNLFPASLKSHNRAFHPPTPPPAAKEEVARGKRAAAQKALAKVSKIAKEIKEETVENFTDEDYNHELGGSKTSDESEGIIAKEKLYLEPEKVHISKELFKDWKDTLDKDGFVICKNKGCIKAMNSMKTIRFHYQTCPNSTHSGLYTCIICQYSCSNRMTIQKHVDVHKMACAGTPTNANEELEFLYRASLPANQTKRKGTRFNLGSSQIYQSIRLGEFDERLFTPHIEFAIQFYRNNFKRNVLFSNWLPLSSHWKPLSETECEPYLPLTKESVEFKNSYVIEEGGELNDSDWKRLKLFKSCSTDSTNHLATCFVGGPVWACAWCPTSHIVPCQQFIAVSSHINMDSTFLCSKAYNSPGLLQLWNLGILEEGNGTMPRFSLGIAHNFGAVWSMAWCPSGCWEDPVLVEDRLPRLGLLAVACSDGFARIYSIPHPSSLHGDEEELPLYLATPAVNLSLAKLSECMVNLQCTSLSWHQGKDHLYIAAGYSNGLVGVWNLATESPLLRVESSLKVETLFPHLTFRAHGTILTGLDFSHLHDGQYLVTVSRDRCVKFWDLQDVSLPYNVMRKRISTGVKWPPHWCGVYTYGDYCYNMIGNCASYLECGYFGEISMNLASHNTCILDASPSYWLNSLVSCDVAGEVVIAVIGHLMQNSNYQKISNHRRLPLYRVETVKRSSESKDSSSEAVSQSGASSDPSACLPQTDELLTPMTYDAAVQNYRLHYKNASLGDLKAIPMQELRHISSSSFMETGKVDEYPLSAVNQVSWNSNLGGHAWIAAGEQSGMLRFIYVKSLDIIGVEKVRNALSTGSSYIPEARKAGAFKEQKM